MAGDDINPANYSWVVELKDEFHKKERKQQEKLPEKSAHTFFRLPANILKNVNHDDYKPSKVSFGPYHHGRHSCEQTQQIKKTVVTQYLEDNFKHLGQFIKCLEPHVQTLKDAYSDLDPKWEQDDSAFLQLMIYDGCFLLEVLNEADRLGYGFNNWGIHDQWKSPIWAINGINPRDLMEDYRHDLFLFENQIPMLVLEQLVHAKTNEPIESVRKLLTRQILLLFSWEVHAEFRETSCQNVLDICKDNLVFEEPNDTSALERCWDLHRVWIYYLFISWIYFLFIYVPSAIMTAVKTVVDCLIAFVGFGPRGGSAKSFHFNIPSATDLNQVGVEFMVSETTSIMDVAFVRRKLRLPRIYVDSATRSTFFNIIVLERFDKHPKKAVSSYVYFMRRLIQSAADVHILKSRGIIHSRLPDDEIVELFKSLMMEAITHDPEVFLPEKYISIVEGLIKRYPKMSREWKRDLWQKYFRSSLGIASLIVAFVLFALTAI